MTPEEEAKMLFDAVSKIEDGQLKTMLLRTMEVFQRRVLRNDLDGPGNSQEIVQFFHCGECLRELQAKGMPESPESYSRLSVGFTLKGVQIWCHRHDLNVFHMDFEGVQHPANTSAAKPGGKFDA